MNGDGVTKQLIAIEQEQRAQKVATPLNYGQLNDVGSTATQVWSGFVANNLGSDDTARWVATFTRTDDINLPPFVDFAWDYTLALTYYQDLIAAGYVTSVTGRDRQAIDQINFLESPKEIGSNYVKWSINIPANSSWFYVSASGTTVSLTVQAISMVPGVLSLVREV